MSLNWWSLGLRTGWAQETGQKTVIFADDEGTADLSLLLFHPWFILITYAKQYPYWPSISLPLITPPCLTTSVLSLIQGLLAAIPTHMPIKVIKPTLLLMAQCCLLASVILDSYPLATREPSSVTVRLTVSPGLWRMDTNEFLNNAAVPHNHSLGKTNYTLRPPDKPSQLIGSWSHRVDPVLHARFSELFDPFLYTLPLKFRHLLDI